MLSGEATNSNFIGFGLNPQYTALEASTLTITPPMRFASICRIQYTCTFTQVMKGPSLSWSYGSWLYNYLCNQCQLPLTLQFRIPLGRGVHDKTFCDKVCQWLATCRWFSPVTPDSSTSPPISKTDRHDITEILLKVALNTITLTPWWY